MPTIIDSLVVTLGLDPKQFKKGTKEAEASLDKTGAKAGKMGKEVEAAGKKAAEAIGALRNEVLRMTAAFVGFSAIRSFVEGATKADAAVGRMARTMNMSIGELSTWRQVAEQAGVSGDAVAGDMDNLSQMLQRFSLTGEGGEAIKYFRALGIALVDNTGKVRDQFEVLLEFADKIKGMDPARAKAIGAGMGFSADTVALALKGRAALQASFAEAKKNALSPEDEAAANARNEAWTRLANTFGRLGRDILTTLTPAITGLLNFINQHAGPAAGVMGALAASLASMALVNLGSTLGQIAQLGGALGGLAGKGGLALSVLGRLGMVGAAGAAGYAAGSLLEEQTGIGSKFGGWLYGLFNKDPDFSGGYVPGTVRGLGQRGAAGGDVASKQAYLRQLESKMGLPAGLLDSVWRQESTRGTNLTSKAGARGDFQFMPGTAKQYGVDVTSFESSAQGAARMYADLLRQFHGDLPSALAGYNWGTGNLQRFGLAGAPAETRNYIASIMGNMRGSQVAGGNSSSVEANIGQIVVQTQATDAKGIARDIGPAIMAQTNALQANAGVF